MRRQLFLTFAITGWLSFQATTVAQKPKLDDVLRSISESSRGDSQPVNWVPVLLVLLGSLLVYIAVKHWNRRQSRPRTLNHHLKLIKETATASGVSARSLKSLEALARAQGLSSPLVAVLCPSAITELAKHVKSDAERKAITELARHVLKP